MKDRELTSQMWSEYRMMLHRFILSRVHDPAVADDIVQDVLIKVHERLHMLNDRSRLVPWMYQITRNGIADHYRRNKPTDDINTFSLASEETDEDIERALARCLLPMIGQLPNKYERAIRLSELNGLPQKEIARLENISLSGAKSRIQRGRKLLKGILLDCCHVEMDHLGKVDNFEPNQGCEPC